MSTPPHVLERRAAVDDALRALLTLDYVARAKTLHSVGIHRDTMERKTMAEMPINLRWRTPQYSALRRRCYERDHFRCQRCGAGLGSLRMHHISYDRVGMADEILDVVTLCEKCHAREHQRTSRGYYHRTDQLGLAA